MRILMVAHGLPPQATGGTEIYSEALARALGRTGGHDVVLLAAEADERRADFAVREEDRDGLRAVRINNTFRAGRSFEDTYRNPALVGPCVRLLDEFRPDVMHVQHLTRLSIDLVAEAAKRRIPVVFTLQDYWLLCHRGQLVDTDYQVCAGPSPAGCARCFGPAGGAGARTYRLAGALRSLEQKTPELAARALRQLAARIALVTTSDTRSLNEAEKRLVQMRSLCGLVSRFLTPSVALARRFIEFGVDEARVLPWNPGIDVASFANARTLRQSNGTVEPGRLRVGFVGSLMVTKGPDVLLRALSLLPRDRVSGHFFGDLTGYHGDDRFIRELEPLLRAPGVERHLVLPPARVPEALASIDVLVVPSTWPENSPFVIREAFAAGLPVVASRIGGIPEIVHDGKDGLLFPAGDHRALARVLDRLIREPELLTRLRNGIGPVRTIEEDASETITLYETVVQGRAAPARRSRDSAVGQSFARRVRNRPNARLAAIVLNYGTPDETLLALRSLQASRRPIDDIFVVDNGASGECERRVKRMAPEVTFIPLPANLGFSGGNNVGIREALRRGAQRILLVNSDVVVPPDTVSTLEEALDSHPEAGVCGPVILSRANPEQVVSAGIGFSPRTGRMHHLYYGRPLSQLDAWFEMQRARASRRTASTSPFNPGSEFASAEPRKTTGEPEWNGSHPVDVVSGCVMMIDSRVFERIGLLEETYFYSFEDLDFCLTAREAGFSSLLVTDAFVYHEGCQSIGARSPRRLYFATRNHLLLAHRLSSSDRQVIRTVRACGIVAMHVAHGLLFAESRPLAGLRYVLLGVADHVRGRYGNPWGERPSTSS